MSALAIGAAGPAGTGLSAYLPVVLMLVFAALFAILSLLASKLLRPSRPTPAKATPYECGIVPERIPEGERFSVKFYLVAMLFIIFDIETIFLFPWAVAFRSLGLFGLIEMAIFIGLVFFAYVYVWRRGGLDWEEVSTVLRRRDTRKVDAEAAVRREVARAG